MEEECTLSVSHMDGIRIVQYTPLSALLWPFYALRVVVSSLLRHTVYRCVFAFSTWFSDTTVATCTFNITHHIPQQVRSCHDARTRMAKPHRAVASRCHAARGQGLCRAPATAWNTHVRLRMRRFRLWLEGDLSRRRRRTLCLCRLPTLYHVVLVSSCTR